MEQREARTQYRILIVEDDAVIAAQIAHNLERWGFLTRAVGDFTAVLSEFSAYRPHLVLMDVSLPYYNGYYWCRKIRESASTPVVFLSSRTDTADAVMGVNMGGDDFITKPVDPELLVAKLTAMLRRSYDYEAAVNPSFRGAEFDVAGACLLQNGKRTPLTKNEAQILALLLERRGAIVSRETLMLKLWDSDEFVDDNTLTVNVNRLRKTLSDAGLTDCVVTHKGRGYSIDA